MNDRFSHGGKLPNHPTFPDPYHDLPAERCLRTSLVTDNEIGVRLNIIHRHRSTMQITLNILLQKLIHELDRIELTSYDPRRYERAVFNARLVLADDGHPVAGSTEPPPPGKAVGGDDGPRTSVVEQAVPGHHDESTTPSVPSQGKFRKTGKKGKSS